jgi:hypothetical protein
VEAVLVDGHADTGTAGLVGAVTAGAGHLSIVIDLVELEHSELDGLVHGLDFLGLGVSLLLSLLATTAKTEHQVKSRLLLDVVIRKSAAILELLAGKDQTLLIRGDTLLVLNLLLDVVNGVGGLHIKCDGLARERLHENLHVSRSTNGVEWSQEN